MDAAMQPANVITDYDAQGQFLNMQPVMVCKEEPGLCAAPLPEIDSSEADSQTLQSEIHGSECSDQTHPITARDSSKLYHCPSCTVVYNLESNLRLHMAIHNTDKLVCPECGKQFRRIACFKSHLNLHETEESFLCAECGEEVPSQFELARHQKERHGPQNENRRYPCQHCEIAFSRLSALRNHERVHSSEMESSVLKKRFRRNFDRSGMSYRCNHCPMKFQNQSRLDSHLRVHTGERPYKCEWCDKTLNHKDTLMRHLDKHLGNRPFRCDLCSAGFVRKSHLRLHTQMVHSQPKGDNQLNLPVDYDAPVLVTVVPIVSSVIKADRKMSASDTDDDMDLDSDDTNDSDEQNASAANGSGLLPTSSSTDDGFIPENADIGSEGDDTTSETAKLQGTGGVQQRQIVRKAHGKTFKRKRRFGKYAAKQSSSASKAAYTCNECHKSFAKLSQLQIHARVHTEEGPFICGVCQSVFSNKNGLDRHLNKHYAQKTHQCAFCEMAFSHRKSLQNHTRRVHPEFYDEGE